MQKKLSAADPTAQSKMRSSADCSLPQAADEFTGIPNKTADLPSTSPCDQAQETALATVSLSVRELVEFILMSGDIDNRGGSTDLYQRANEGSRLHRKLQRQAHEQYGENYRSEVVFSDERTLDGIHFSVFGRADGVLHEQGDWIIEEIKSTELPLSLISGQPHSPGYNLLHWAQAKCYAFILSQQQNLDRVGVRLIYCQVETEEVERFTSFFDRDCLSQFYLDLLRRYLRWAKLRSDWSTLRNRAAIGLPFPFPSYRQGQRQMAAVIYRAASSSSRVLCQAPTGIGKTISSLFPAVKAMGEGKLSHIFYLTAKTSTRAVAEEGFARMQQRGMRLKRVTLTAKDKICFLQERLCNPDDCPYAKGYYDRIQDVLFKMLQTEDAFTRDSIVRWAKQEQLCPFELGLDLSLWCDAIICDYNYLFDPVVYLKRFFDHRDQYCFLIDEAHNLIDRARSMYSATLQKSQVLSCKKPAQALSRPLASAISSLNREMLSLKRKLRDPEKPQQENFLTLHEIPDSFLRAAQRLSAACSQFLEEQRRDKLHRGIFAQGEKVPQEILQLYFDVRFFTRIAELFDERFVFFVSSYRSEVTVKLLCLDPARMIDSRLTLGRCTALFSATLSPPSYYKEVLGCDDPQQLTHSYALASPFCPQNLCLLLCPQINTRWAAREESLLPIAKLLFSLVEAKSGNYLAYFPSYQYLQMEAEVFAKTYPDIQLLLQSPDMDDQAREDFLRQFDTPHHDAPMLAFAVLGGVYSEGVDLKGDKLLGTAIVGTGLPKVGAQQEILRDYYQQKNQHGFDFAYRYPGMNKVLQAAGRVIRSDQDRGVVLLLDDRFCSASYRRLFPAHWSHASVVYDEDQLRQTLQQFWEVGDCAAEQKQIP